VSLPFSSSLSLCRHRSLSYCCRRRWQPSLGLCRETGWAATVSPWSRLWNFNPCVGSSTTARGPRTTLVPPTPEPPPASLFCIFIPMIVDCEEAEGDVDRHQLTSPANSFHPRLEGFRSRVHGGRMPRDAGGGGESSLFFDLGSIDMTGDLTLTSCTSRRGGRGSVRWQLRSLAALHLGSRCRCLRCCRTLPPSSSLPLFHPTLDPTDRSILHPDACSILCKA